MSEAVFASLPRFDVLGARPPEEAMRSSARECAFEPVETALPEGKPETFPEPGHPEQADLVSSEAPTAEATAIEATLTALSDAVESLEHQAREQVTMATQAIAAKLFPELSRLFMAEEIGRHLSTMVPVSGPAVIIHADVSLIEEMQEVINKTGRLAAHCTLQPNDSGAQGRVDISWQTGGVSFDFSGVLDACLAQLHDTHSNTGT